MYHVDNVPVDIREMARQLKASICCFFRGPGFTSQNAHDGSQPSITPVSGDPTPFLSSVGIRQTCAAHKYMQQILIHVRKIKQKKPHLLRMLMHTVCMSKLGEPVPTARTGERGVRSKGKQNAGNACRMGTVLQQ